jgi:hypothetical protein
MHHCRLVKAEAPSPMLWKAGSTPSTSVCINAQHMALTIDEELSLHNRLLTELDDDVTVTHSRMKVQMHHASFQAVCSGASGTSSTCIQRCRWTSWCAATGSWSCVISCCLVLLILNSSLLYSGLQAAQKRVRQILRDSGGCKFSCAAFGLALVLVLLIVLLFKLL